jgi:hypothetical protein
MCELLAQFLNGRNLWSGEILSLNGWRAGGVVTLFLAE